MHRQFAFDNRTLPFGPILEADGVRFRLWAPGAKQVDVVLVGQDQEQRVAMPTTRDGWHEVLVPEAGVGSLYHFKINGETLVPDPGSRFQPEDLSGPSQVVDTAGFTWENSDWKGRPWAETVLYELHVGTFTPEGTYDGVRARLPYLKELGVTAVELMPLADFPGSRNWGYDGVLPFAPDSVYGSPQELRRLIDEAHGLGLMVFLDVVYNHFGPEGNYLHLYAPQFFTEAHQTPWGAAIDFSVPQVRDFFIANAVYWLQEYRFDGLRLDAVHAIQDDGPVHILEELAQTVTKAFPQDRHVHLVLENDANQARFLNREGTGEPKYYVAQWNDDIHHVYHVLGTGETQGYYADYADNALDRLGRCLAQGFAYQGEPSAHRGGEARGEPSAHLPPEAFVAFIQNHDQIGNRALGERLPQLAPLEKRTALTAMYLLAPQIPMLYMGEEWATERPFPFFCDFQGDLADAVREGRRKEFAAFPEFADPGMRERIPDPNDPATAQSAVLNWDERYSVEHAQWLTFYRDLLSLRQARIVPLLGLMQPGAATWQIQEPSVLIVNWPLTDGRTLRMTGNLGSKSFLTNFDLENDPDSLDAIYVSPYAQRKGSGVELEGWGVMWTVVPK
ncbi:malto-oligosyltrehalose trehalohydrolase [Desulfonatronum sp. SC1]|uniref:malto-oligosyltrehalose trehalohydrolase n=1 Tax=Desulfonatronum sp. SC1 TaxID=2109626 RepID=UPI000D311667|nr:malto-oligosyltrehalose trehalohydrolase [Desulfonatronum sp. SC1]PTN35339.1 malto-oligosyltrehalose trehalohydrolase [Desulfonatronum sp. SC1]